MRNALDIFYIMLMLKSPSSEPSGALVKSNVPEPADVRVSDTEIVVKLAKTADK